MLRSRLRERLDEFLPTVRVGIDFGEHAGGIAIVQGNRILHAETYLDFHEADLEKRRQLRRGRRTRHAKKMRLARLRSWVLRQRLPDGSRLPDPYRLLNDKRFWVPPGLYERKISDPRNADGWVEKAKQGEVDANGFVRALTLIFKKRGYKFDNRGLNELTDKQLEDFLQHARIPPEAQDLHQAIEQELKRREEYANDPVRGRKKIQVPVLRQLFETACRRERQPKIAEDRRVKEADLQAVVAGFATAVGLSEQETMRWRAELVRLLNKTLRPARFDNRIRSTCAWCGQRTPRKSKVREIAYHAAVHNLRVRVGRRERPLIEEERKEFLGWWCDRENAPGLETIKKRLRRLNPKQVGMANQLYDLLKRDRPAGRASLCREHLHMAAEGKTMKDAGVAWQTIGARKTANPCREQHDARVLYRLERLLFIPEKRGEAAWSHGPVSLISLELPEPQTERVKPGQTTERKEGTFKERLLQELDGQCVYCGNPSTDKDHIFPRAQEGPDVWHNLVAVCTSCNDEKGDRTPWQWFGSDAQRWETFKSRVETLPLPSRKKEVLLNEADEFPGGDPTPFARVGARPRQFVKAVRDMFIRYGVPPPELFVQHGTPHIQRIDGRLTSKLRESWRFGVDGTTENFPTKNSWDLANHAQDAVLIAACPPHIWRDLIFCEEGRRPGKKDGRLVIKPGLATQTLAPDWAGFENAQAYPLVRILGRYPSGWHGTIFNETLWRNPSKARKNKLVVHKPVDELTAKEVKEIVSPYYRDRLLSLAKKLGLQDNKPIPSDTLRQEIPGVRHLKVYRQKPSAVVVLIKPKHGPERHLAARPEAASEGVIFWTLRKNVRRQLGISVLRPKSLHRFGVPPYQPPIPEGAVRLGRWKRHQLIQLPEDRRSDHPAGWYRVKEFSDSGVVVLPERALPVEIAKRIGLKKGVTEAGLAPFKERKLGKKELMAYLLQRRRRHGDARRQEYSTQR